MEKAEFIEELFELYKKGGNQLSLVSMKYVRDEDSEWVVVNFGEGVFQRFNVGGYNSQGILLEFARFLSNRNDYDWIYT